MPPLRPVPPARPSVPAPDRRSVLRLMAASFALAGLSACDGADPDGEYVPAVIAPAGIVSGIPNHYATAVVEDGTALGVIVEHAMGRPIKIEGNPAHPSSLGATDAVTQAAILDLWDPERAVAIQHQRRPATRQALLAEFARLRGQLADSQGRGLRILTGPTSSPSLIAALAAVTARYPGARAHVCASAAASPARSGAAIAYGRDVAILPHLQAADLIVSLGGDLLADRPGAVRFARDFAARRNPARGPMSRVYAAEPTPTLIGAAADHRIAADPAALRAAITALAAGLLGGGSAPDAPGFVAPGFVAPILAELQAARGRAFIDAGPDLPPEAHALVLAMNEALGGRGRTFDLIDPPLAAMAPLEDLERDLAAGAVEQLIILGCNPAFTVPGFEQALGRASFSLASNVDDDETGAAAQWFVPQAHPLEDWADARAHDGTATILQPQTMPLHGGWSPLALLSLLDAPQPADPLDAVRRTWRERLGDETAWHQALADGVVTGTAHQPLDLPLSAAARAATLPAAPAASLHVLLREDPYLPGGRHANNGWLQELPRPHTKLTWDNPLLLPPALAASLGVSNGDTVALAAGAGRAELPVWILPGQAEGCAVVTSGNGRRVVGTVGSGAGFDTYPIRALLAAGPPTLRRAGGHVDLATTDRSGRDPTDTSDILRRTTLERFEAEPRIGGPRNPEPHDLLYRRRPDGPAQWGMSIDLNACIGCNACVTACQAENNVPVVGKTEVLHQREMHWIRIDRYDIGEDAVEPAFQPVLCMHCEQAPCEAVCPVEATQHDQEGLNLMVYNRCVGTRFCSNNCPYKVRRFNFASYADEELRPPIARNPDVSVRARGVMEKCTFCVQRIAAARIAHDRDGVPERTATACQSVCPTQAITFGNLADPESEVSRRKQSPLDYPLLPEESTYPRVTYEARVRNRGKAAKS